MKSQELKKHIYLIEGFWSAAKCDDFIRESERRGYEPATIQTDNGPRIVDHVRNNNRVVYKDFDLANTV